MNLKTTTSRSTGTVLLAPIVLCLTAAACQIPDAPAQAAQERGEPWNWSEEYVRAGVNRVRAGRDLTPESWPDGARVAVLLSFDVDNETIQGLRSGTFSIGPLSQGEYGSRVALPRIVRLLDGENIPATFFFPAWSLKLAPEQADVINASGMHEIGVHGWIHEFDKAWEEGTMFLLTMHPHVSGHRSRIVALEGLIDHIQAKGDVWFATHEDAARYVREQAGMD